MNNINFKPWVGENYATTGFKGKKILVLGYSHYCKVSLSEGGRCFPSCTKAKMRKSCHDETINCVGKFVDEHSGFKQYLCFERAIYGRPLTDEESSEFWNGIIFYNYIQYSVGKGPGVVVKDNYWDKSEKLFKVVLEKYMPDYIIVWGGKLYDNLPNWNGTESQIKINDDILHIWTYTIKGKQIQAMECYHPSWPPGISWSRWHPFHSKFLGLPQL